MIVDVFYLNDEQKEITVRILDDRYDGTTGLGDVFDKLKSCEGKVYEVHMPANCVIYVKKWKDMVMISYTDPTGLPRCGEHSPRSGAV